MSESPRKHLSFSEEKEVRFRRRKVVVDKIEISMKKNKITELMKKDVNSANL